MGVVGFKFCLTLSPCLPGPFRTFIAIYHIFGMLREQVHPVRAFGLGIVSPTPSPLGRRRVK